MRFLVPELPQCSPEELAAAVRRAILQAAAVQPSDEVTGRLPSETDLPGHGDLTGPQARRTARALALLEGAYLVAATDGLDAAEREALALLIARVLGGSTADAVTVLLESFDERLRKDGFDARAKEVASCFAERSAAEGALGFATLLALADRRLAIEEQEALLALGAALGFRPSEVQLVVHLVAHRLEQALAAVASH